MSVQDTYRETLRPGLPGAIVDMVPRSLISRTVEAAGGLAFGVGVARGTADEGCVPFGVGHTAANFLGFSVRERSVAAEQDKFVQYDSARIMTFGTLWVQASAAVADGNPVFINPANGNLDDADNTAGTLEDTGWIWDSTTSGAGIAKIRKPK